MSNRLIDDRGTPAKAGVEPAWTALDLDAMNRARELARAGAGCTGPNPTVGAVVVNGGRVVATGFHRGCGHAHAEVVALDQAGEAARGGTLYVTLEPCAHQGRTPPCVERIIRSGVARVVCPAIDPDPRVRGRGIAALRAAGIHVDVGCQADAAVLDTLAFYRDRLGFATTVTLKMAVSDDGMVARAPGQRDDVTGEIARSDAHALRAIHDAVVVGIETVLVDCPRLDCRLLAGGVDRSPVPVVLDTHARTPLDNAWSAAGREYIVVCGHEADADALLRAGATVMRARATASGLDVEDVLRALARASLRHVLVEGGPRVFWSFADGGHWDAAWLYRSDRVFGAGGVPLFRSGDERFPGRLVDETPMGPDRRIGFANPLSWDRMMTALDQAKG